jgi:hypothetical protein
MVLRGQDSNSFTVSGSYLNHVSVPVMLSVYYLFNKCAVLDIIIDTELYFSFHAKVLYTNLVLPYYRTDILHYIILYNSCY